MCMYLRAYIEKLRRPRHAEVAAALCVLIGYGKEVRAHITLRAERHVVVQLLIAAMGRHDPARHVHRGSVKG